MKFFTVFAAIFFAVQAFAQDVKGYYVTYDGKKVEGYFKQGDFNDVSSLEFKKSSKSEFIKLSPDAINEYGTGDEFKFEKHLVQVDMAPVNTKQKNPEMKAETLFLSVIISGNTSLYSYTKDYNTKFFIKTNGKTEPEQLIYRKYQTEDGSVAENAMFRQQLFNLVNCKHKSADDFIEVIYYRKQLSDIVKEDNECQGVDTKEFFNDTRRESDFYYSAFIGLYNQKLAIENSNPSFGQDSKLNFTAGLEVSYVFKSQTSALFFRVEYERFSSTKDIEVVQTINMLNTKYNIDVSVVNFLFGPRYNFVALDNHKVFIDGGFGLSVPFGDIKKNTNVINDAGSYGGGSFKYKLIPSLNFGIGAGYILNNAYGIAIRYEIDRDYLDYAAYQTKFGRFGVNLSYYFN